MTPRRTLFVCIAVVLALFGFACMGWGTPGDMAVALLAGWAWFLARTAASMTVDWSAVVLGAVALALLAFGLHRFLRWLYPAVAADSDGVNSVWQLRWSMAALSVTLLMFCAGISIIGMTHQIVWLTTSESPFQIDTGGVRGAARRSVSRNNLKQMGLALHAYHDTSKAFPPGGTFDENGQPFHSWQTFLLPFIEQNPVYERISFSDPWDDPQNEKPFRTRIDIYTNPGVKNDSTLDDNDAYASSHYAANGWVVGGHAGLKIAEIRDGAATTILAGEVADHFKPWGDPTNWRDPQLGINKSPFGFGGPFKGGSQFVFADGSTRFLSEGINPQVLHALSTPSGGEAVQENDY